MRNKIILTHERLLEVLNYDPATGIFVWKIGQRKGVQAGCIKKDGYRRIRIDNDGYQSGRLAFLYMTGRWPVPTIDHKNMIRDDDRWDNLIEATRCEQNDNRTISLHIPSGTSGITWLARHNKWRGRLKIKGRHRRISFGWFSTIEEAIIARTKLLEELNKDGSEE